MSNSTEGIVREVLECVGNTNRAFRDAAIELRRMPQVENVATALEIMNYDSGPLIEGYVDAELSDGNGICWRLDVTWDSNSWNIRGVLERNSASGTDILERMPPQNVPEIAQLPEALARAAGKLLSLRPQELTE